MDCIRNVASIEWAGEDALLFTVPDALGRPHQARLPKFISAWCNCALLIRASGMSVLNTHFCLTQERPG